MVTRTKDKVITKGELIARMVKKNGFTKKDTEKWMKNWWEVIIEALREGEKVQMIPYGSFEVRMRKERIGRNPRTGERLEIKAMKVPVFKPGKKMRDMVRNLQ